MAKTTRNNGGDSQQTTTEAAMRHEAAQVAEEHPIGKVIHLSTVTHGWRGILVHVSETHYYLAKAHMVNGTGRIKDYTDNGLSGGSEESPELGGLCRIPRGAVAWEYVVDKGYCARWGA